MARSIVVWWLAAFVAILLVAHVPLARIAHREAHTTQSNDELAKVRDLFKFAVFLENQSPAGEGAAAAMENLTALLQRLNGRCA